MKFAASILILLTFALPALCRQADSDDKQMLGKALDYFMGGKYHEALVMLVPLDKKYKLNARFKAYIGICYYHDWNYKKACEYLDEAMPELEVYAPHERSVYYGILAESRFELGEYGRAIPVYEKQLLVCYDNEKGDVLYRLGFCYMFLENWQNAEDYFKSALIYYTKYPSVDKEARKPQLEKMIKGCEDRIKTGVE